ncbi:glycosyltransferase family 2 protein [Poseidonocella sp. HB161398]|uniref:glycosyltransferase family 2 protein n=1 Tax=Poseidonocella sp. HB161398 TaxID=2320855 RepID=UPI001108AB4C|nr:glycosyltransferase family 2 protein [Poseidonocella sp. HB161398]
MFPENRSPASEFVPEISVCVPIYNEEDSVGPLCEAIVAALEPTGRDFEMVLVDDGSTDLSVERLTKIAERDPRLVVVCFQRNYGQTAAMMAGIDHARGRYVVTMDGDLQNDPLDIPMMLEKLDKGYDLVVGYRINRQDKFFSRKLPSKIANALIGWTTGLRIRDNGCSLKVYRADVIQRTPLYADMHRFIPVMSLPLGARVAEVGVRHHARRFGESKYGLSRIFKVLLDLVTIKTLQLFSRRPLARFSSGATLSALAAVVMHFALRSEDVVISTTVTGLLFGLSVFLFFLGLVTGAMYQGSEKGSP